MLLCPWGFPGKNTGVDCHFFLQGIFSTQVWNPLLLCLLHCRQIFFFYQLSYQGSIVTSKNDNYLHGDGLVAKSCPTLPPNGAHQAPLSMGFPRQEYWSGLPFPSPEDLPDPGVELTSPALQADSLWLSHLGSPITFLNP